jgi:chaperonin cofactor prefoldin
VSDNELKQHLDERFDSVDKRLERVEEKLDDHLSRLSTAEASIEWLRGHAKLSITIILSVAGFLASLYFRKGA